MPVGSHCREGASIALIHQPFQIFDVIRVSGLYLFQQIWQFPGFEMLLVNLFRRAIFDNYFKEVIDNLFSGIEQDGIDRIETIRGDLK